MGAAWPKILDITKRRTTNGTAYILEHVEVAKHTGIKFEFSLWEWLC